MKQPLSRTITVLFLLLNALTWCAFGLLILTGRHPHLPDSPTVRIVMGGLGFACAAFLVLMLILLKKRFRFAYYATLVFFFLSAVVTFFDQVGWVDLLFILGNLLPAALMIKDRAAYLPASADRR